MPRQPDFSTLLVNCPTPPDMPNKEFILPSSLLYLAGYLQAAGEAVEVLDCNTLRPWETDPEHPENACLEPLLERVAVSKPGLIGISCLFSGQFPTVLKFAAAIKRHHPDLRIVIGGMHPTIFPTEILTHCADIDYVVIGEGESQLLALVRHLKSGGSAFGELPEGLAFRESGQVVVRPKTSFFTDLDALPPPAYNLFDFAAYEHDTHHWHNPRNLPIGVSAPIISSRSCPNRCPFCSMFMVMGPRFRARSAKHVVEEMRLLYETRGVRHFTFMDDNLTYSRRRILEICENIRQANMDIQFETPNGLMVRTLDAEVLDAMAESGWVRGAIAIESGSDYIRNTIMGKKLPSDMIFKAIECIRKHPQVYIKAYFLMGMPEDTRETLEESVGMINQLDVDEVYVTNVIPFPGTELYKQCHRDGLLLDIDPQTLWKENVFYYTDNKRFFIKPYATSLDILAEYRKIFDIAVQRKKESAWRRRREPAAEQVSL